MGINIKATVFRNNCTCCSLKIYRGCSGYLEIICELKYAYELPFLGQQALLMWYPFISTIVLHIFFLFRGLSHITMILILYHFPLKTFRNALIVCKCLSSNALLRGTNAQKYKRKAPGNLIGMSLKKYHGRIHRIVKNLYLGPVYFIKLFSINFD